MYKKKTQLPRNRSRLGASSKSQDADCHSDLELSSYLSCFYFIPRSTAPAFEIWEDFTFLSIHARMHLTPPFLLHNWGINTGRGGTSRPCHLSWKAGALYCLRPFFYLVLVATSVYCHHLTGSRFDMVSFMVAYCCYWFPPKGYHTDNK